MSSFTIEIAERALSITGSRAHRRLRLISAAALAVVALLLFTPLIAQMIREGSDYVDHIRYAETFMGAQLNLHPRPHILYSGLVYLFSRLIPAGGIWTAGLLVAAGAYVATCLIIFGQLRRALPSLAPVKALPLSFVSVFVLVLLSPITLPTWSTNNLYLGYISTASYHSPTFVLLVPIALLLFRESQLLFVAPPAKSWASFLPLALLGLAAPLAKPNYVLCLVPAIVILSGIRLLRREYVGWKPLALAVILPVAVVLGYQYGFFTSRDGFAIEPFKVMSAYATNFPSGLKLALSVAFPAVVSIAYWPHARRSLTLNLAWLTFFVGVAQAYLLVETGTDRWTHANFVWGAQASLFVLFVASMTFWLRRVFPRSPAPATRSSRLAFLLTLSALALHFLCGVVWYAVNLSGQRAAWW